MSKPNSSELEVPVRDISSAANVERPPFRAPTKHELIEFRKHIEAGNCKQVKRLVWKNPRYLISSGDTPTTLKDGFRYNAMHICAQANQPHVAELLLKIISDPEFAQLYAGRQASKEMCAALSANLLDYYLNIPDRGRCETPLHFAVKYGHVAVVELLTSYPQCKSLLNKDHQLPKHMVCLRAPQTDPMVVKKIELLLNGPYYVPVLRAVGNELSPQVGQPFTPTDPPKLQNKQEDREPLCVPLAIGALAGPMPRTQAENFYRRWKTTPRLSSIKHSPLVSPPYISPTKTPARSTLNKRSGARRLCFSVHQADSNQKLEECDGGTDKGGEEVKKVFTAKQLFGLPSTPMRKQQSKLFSEYREISSSPFTDIQVQTPETSLMDTSVTMVGDSFRERHIKNSDIEKGLEMVGRQLARQEDLEWREYWDFLDILVDIASVEGLRQLESYLAEKSHQNSDRENTAGKNTLFQLPSGSETAATASTLQVMRPYICVEKSLQVFARRIAKSLIYNIGQMVSINDILVSELKHLKSLIVSFKEDARFKDVDFAKVHSRIAHLMASYIIHSQEMSCETMRKLLEALDMLLHLQGDWRDFGHLYCVCGTLFQMLKQLPHMKLLDALQTEELCGAAWEKEQWCPCQWEEHRKPNRRRRAESLRAQIVPTNTPGHGLAHTSLSSVAIVADIPLTAWHKRENADSDEEFPFYDCRSEPYFASDEEEEVFVTPPQSLSPVCSCKNVKPAYELFIFGKEPTKRDLDVLNAIFHVDIAKETHPHIYAWKVAMKSFSADEMDRFPAPKNIPPNVHLGGSVKSPSKEKTSSVVKRKRLFGTPKLNAVAPRPERDGTSLL
ncbi:uncharacterized protein LOC115621757 [Scaptodrosophila lebanonensis]|uniref:Uncharacterized protein LOC115621757 n=1 Tax=Drosophila lebanonensis TaxID=7225 RepID=A0A6J2T351_DROLE|nr:uncharacterized protein LOC115621757 [Scaptodrosophila lebanonensis]